MAEPKITGRRRTRLIWAIVLVFILLLLFVFHNPLLSRAGRWLNVAEMPRHSEYVMVLGGGDERRPFVAAALVRERYAERVLVPAVHPSPDVVDGIVPPDHERIIQVLVRRGVLADNVVVLDADVRTTYDEAAALGEFLNSQPGARVTIVTDDYHTRRCRWIFRRELGDQSGDIFFVAAPMDDFSRHNWWKRRDGLKAYTSEYLKLGYYWCRYGWGLAWIAVFVLLTAIIAFRRIIAERCRTRTAR